MDAPRYPNPVREALARAVKDDSRIHGIENLLLITGDTLRHPPANRQVRSRGGRGPREDR